MEKVADVLSSGYFPSLLSVGCFFFPYRHVDVARVVVEEEQLSSRGLVEDKT
jgi:hypothetical protein